jgi:hypothetical protein
MALKDVFGVTRIANLTGLDGTGIPVVMVCRPNARSSAVFNGKGVDGRRESQARRRLQPHSGDGDRGRAGSRGQARARAVPIEAAGGRTAPDERHGLRAVTPASCRPAIRDVIEKLL